MPHIVPLLLLSMAAVASVSGKDVAVTLTFDTLTVEELLSVCEVVSRKQVRAERDVPLKLLVDVRGFRARKPEFVATVSELLLKQAGVRIIADKAGNFVAKLEKEK